MGLSCEMFDLFPIQDIQHHSTSCMELCHTKSSATITTFKAYLETELFSATYDTPTRSNISAATGGRRLRFELST